MHTISSSLSKKANPVVSDNHLTDTLVDVNILRKDKKLRKKAVSELNSLGLLSSTDLNSSTSSDLDESDLDRQSSSTNSEDSSEDSDKISKFSKSKKHSKKKIKEEVRNSF